MMAVLGVHFLSGLSVYIYFFNFFVAFFSLPFSELSLVGLALDLVD